jgi:hypothetical protein
MGVVGEDAEIARLPRHPPRDLRSEQGQLGERLRQLPADRSRGHDLSEETVEAGERQGRRSVDQSSS